MTKPSEQLFTAFPASGSGPGVLVLHPWWGLNAFIREFCHRLAGKGFIALAPDLYHGEIAATIPEAEQLSAKIDQQQASRDILAAQDQLRQLPGVSEHPTGVIGFSLGASWGLWLACEKPAGIGAVTLFYGTGEGDLSRSQAAFLGHFAETDPYESAAYIKIVEESLLAAGRPVTFHIYPGTGHWFFESDRPDAYNPAAASLAWNRTLEFLRQALWSE